MSKFTKWYPLFGLAATFFPLAAQAQTVQTILTNISTTFSSLVAILFLLATITFIWSIIKYILSKSPEEQAKAKSLMLWSIIGLAVISAGWGIAKILINFLGAGGGVIPTVPGQ